MTTVLFLAIGYLVIGIIVGACFALLLDKDDLCFFTGGLIGLIACVAWPAFLLAGVVFLFATLIKSLLDARRKRKTQAWIDSLN